MNKKDQHLEEVMIQLKKYVESVNFGAITLVIQNNHVIQIEVNEKIRLK